MKAFRINRVSYSHLFRIKLFLTFIACIFLIFVSNISYSKNKPVDESSTSEISQNSENKDMYGRETPQGTVKGFLEAFSRNDYNQAFLYFDLKNAPNKLIEGTDQALIENFRLLLDKKGKLVPLGILSTQQEGDLLDGLGPNLEEVGSINWEDETIPIFLERLKGEQDIEIWMVSSTTLQELPSNLKKVDETGVNQYLPQLLLKTKWQGAPLADWLSMILILCVSLGFSWTLLKVCIYLIKSLLKDYFHQKIEMLIQSLLVPVSIVIAVTIFLISLRYLGISIIVRQVSGIVNISLLWTALFLFLWLLIDTFFASSEETMRRKNNQGGLSVVLFFRRSFKFILVVVTLIAILNTIGVDVSAGLAALGIGGLAIALGAQKTIENFVGSLTVIFDQPVRVGDFCQVGNTLGTIENIGLRSTRIRTLERTIVTIPNGDFSSQLIENYTQRDKFLFRTILGLRYETSSNQMRYVLTELRSLLYAHPKVATKLTPIEPRVRFIGYGSDSLQVEVFAYILVSEYSEYLAIQEDINLRISSIVEESGSGFAFPSQTIYLARDSTNSKDKKRRAEKSIEEQIQKNDLQFPDLSENMKKNLQNTIDYPPQGSCNI